MVVRIHHVIGDGISLVQTMARMFEETPNPSPSTDESPRRETSPPPSGLISTLSKVLSGAGALVDILTLAASPYDSDIKFSSPSKKDLVMTPTRSVVYFPSIHLDYIKAIKNAAGVTVNDVM